MDIYIQEGEDHAGSDIALSPLISVNKQFMLVLYPRTAGSTFDCDVKI